MKDEAAAAVEAERNAPNAIVGATILECACQRCGALFTVLRQSAMEITQFLPGFCSETCRVAREREVRQASERRRREREGNDPALIARRREVQQASKRRRRERERNDPALIARRREWDRLRHIRDREKRNAATRRRAASPEARQKANVRHHERMASDPVYRERCIRQSTEATRKWRRNATPEAKRERDRRSVRHSRTHNLLGYMLKGKKAQAKRAGIEFNLSISDFPGGIPPTCPILGIPIDPFEGKKHGTPSFDRIDPNKGYVPGNVVIISWRANHLKADSISPDEMRRVARYVEWCEKGGGEWPATSAGARKVEAPPLEIVARTRQRNPTPEMERERSRRNIRNSRLRNPLRFILWQKKGQARYHGIEFNLSIRDFPDGIPATCPVLGIPIDPFGGGVCGNRNSPSFDRIDPNKGYVPGNVVIISWRANRLKSDCVSTEEMQKVADYVERMAAELVNHGQRIP